MAKGGASEAATEPPSKQTRTPTRRKLDMLAANDAGVREDDAADDTVDISHGVSLPGSALTDPSSAEPPDTKTKTKTREKSAPSTNASRERVWSLLLGNVVRAVDEVYFLCEMECGAPEIEGTASLLEACAADFKALLARVGDQERFLETHDDKKNTSISWDVGRVAVRPSDASREMIRAVVDADKEKSGEKGAWRPAGGKRGERRREKEKAEKAEGPRGKPSRRERRGKGAERMIDSDENTEKAEKKETSKAVADDARVRLPAKAKTKTLAPGSKPNAPRPPRPAAEVSSREALFAEPDKKQKSGVESTDRSDAEPNPPRGSSLAASGASASSFGSWADSDDDDASLPPPFDDAGVGSSPAAPESRVPRLVSDSRTVWNAKRDWGAILAPQKASLHLKLMSPDRKKKTPGETAALLLERQARATEARARAESERLIRASRLRNGGDPDKPRLTAAEKELLAARALELKTKELEERQRRAEETREARIDAVVRKASEETRKVESIALLHSLEAANKKAALRERLADAEKRRASVAEQRRVSAEAAESAARAAEERRLAEETRKRLRAEERLREKELRRDALAKEVALREAAIVEKKTEEASFKLAEREAREKRAKKEADERRDETRKRLLAADARRREYLNLVRERAMGSSTPGRSERESFAQHAESSPAPASPSRTTPFASSVSPSAALESPSRPSRAVAGEALERRVAAVADRHRAMRKRAKKLRQRLAAAAGPVVWRRGADRVEIDVSQTSEPRETGKKHPAEDDETKDEKSWSCLPEHADAASPRLRKLAVAVARRDAEKCLNAHREVRVALAEAGAAAAAAGAEEHGAAQGLAPGAAAAAAALGGAVTSGLVRAVAEALAECLAASAQGGGFLASPEAAVTCVSLAVALDCATAGSPLAAEALLVENLAAPLVPHLVAGLGLVGDPAAMEAATPGAGGGVPPPTAALEPLLAVVTRVANGPRFFVERDAGDLRAVSKGAAAPRKTRETVYKPCARYEKLLDDFTQLLVSSGAVDALASLFALCDRPKEQSVEPVPPAILAGLRLLESLIESGGSFSGGVSEGQGSLIVALRATALAGLPSLLTSVLLQTENETRAPVLADPILAASRLPANFVPVATVTMRLLNNIHAVFGPREVQSVLSSSDLRVETHHLLSVCLAICCGEWDRAPKQSEERRDGKDDGVHDGVVSSVDEEKTSSSSSRWTLEQIASLLDETLLFIGAFALLCPANQDMLRWGRFPTLAQRLPDLPFPYYADVKKKAALFPTLVAVAFRHDTNKAAIARDLSLETLRAFIAKEMEEDASETSETSQTKQSSSARLAGLPSRFDFANRFPRELWSDAALYFASDA